MIGYDRIRAPLCSDNQVTYDPTSHRRRSLRLKDYDYAQAGAYFVTICTQDRVCLFGDVTDGAMSLNAAGQLVATLWTDVTVRFPDACLDAFVVMPNHIHGIILLRDTIGAPLVGAQIDNEATTRVAPTIGDIVGAFKSSTTVEYVRAAKAHRWPAFHRRLWQRNYYEHIIRDEPELSRIRRYIDENPARWDFDDENPQRIAS
jgi:putative transposase